MFIIIIISSDSIQLMLSRQGNEFNWERERKNKENELFITSKHTMQYSNKHFISITLWPTFNEIFISMQGISKWYL